MAKPSQPIQVDCYAGYQGDEEPRRFVVSARQVHVARVVDRWITPSHRYFVVKGDDGVLYRLRHHTGSGAWELDRTSTP